jgi:hypothetical protein
MENPHDNGITESLMIVTRAGVSGAGVMAGATGVGEAGAVGQRAGGCAL